MTGETITDTLQRIRKISDDKNNVSGQAFGMIFTELNEAKAQLAVVRDAAEAIRDAHFIDGRSNGLCSCEQKYPCFERRHAQAILDATGGKP